MDGEGTTPGPATKKQRRHVSRACDICKTKRAKCDGTQPCGRCQMRQLDCTYELPHLRGSKVPPIQPAVAAGEVVASSPREPETMMTESEAQVTADVSRESTPNTTEGFLGQSSNLAYSQAARFELTSRPSSLPNDGSGAPVAAGSNGAASQSELPGRKRGRMPYLEKKGIVSSQSYPAFQDPPFPPLNIARYSILTVERGLEMASWYFDIAVPTYRILHRPSVERLITTMCRSNDWLGGGTAGEAIEDGEPLDSTDECLVLMVWALSCQYAVFPQGRKIPSTAREWLHRKGMEYYQVAELTLEKNNTTLDKMSALQVRFLMTHYLLTTSRLKAAWDLFAIVKNMANNLDLGRLHSTTSSFKSDLSPLNLELRKRAFWSIYTLDTYLCVMLGKSLMFDEVGIYTAHPTADDELIDAHTTYQEYSTGLAQTAGMSLMLCPMAHAHLARIVRKSLKSLYLGPRNDTDQLIIESLGSEMRDWEATLPDFLSMKSTIGLRDVYARQNTVMRLATQHALIMIYRPSLPLSGLAARTSSASSAELHGFLDATSLRICQDRCLQAALEVHSICTSLFKKGDVNDHYWYTLYILFCAATVMLVHIAHHPGGVQAQSAWTAAQECCQMERRVSQSNRLARRYVAALEVGELPAMSNSIDSVALQTGLWGSMSRSVMHRTTTAWPTSRTSDEADTPHRTSPSSPGSASQERLAAHKTPELAQYGP
ncbi:fungal-specific transcription factor domain-containing protein [Elsinoe ampelina]|uniref:Fungal-specific transcription factor domain-containing protein n=1 Tax=Elsinoe ampelina TaxID=302913 RepID=A0A6A6G8G9_9PEZI|nr:fungal-specific transcription factor domain-containing protein [Elsinoe ampelina]